MVDPARRNCHKSSSALMGSHTADGVTPCGRPFDERAGADGAASRHLRGPRDLHRHPLGLPLEQPAPVNSHTLQPWMHAWHTCTGKQKARPRNCVRAAAATSPAAHSPSCAGLARQATGYEPRLSACDGPSVTQQSLGADLSGDGRANQRPSATRRASESPS